MVMNEIYPWNNWRQRKKFHITATLKKRFSLDREGGMGVPDMWQCPQLSTFIDINITYLYLGLAPFSRRIWTISVWPLDMIID